MFGDGWLVRTAATVVVALGVVACADEADEPARDPGTTVERSTTTAEEPSSTTTSTLPDAPPWDGKDGFYPVLSVRPEACPSDGAPDRGTALVTDVDGMCLTLNTDDGVDTGIVESAAPEPSVGTGAYEVAVVLTTPGVDRFNLLASECYSGFDHCPTRQLAIVADGYVVSAPTIEQPEFDRDGLVVTSGTNMTETQATAIADALSP
jgi:SecD-like export protein